MTRHKGSAQSKVYDDSFKQSNPKEFDIIVDECLVGSIQSHLQANKIQDTSKEGKEIDFSW